MEKIGWMNDILKSFKINAVCEKYNKIRNISFYDIRLNPGAKVRDLERCSREISLSMRAKAIPMIQEVMSEGILRLQIVDEDPILIDFSKRFSELSPPKDSILPFYLGEMSEGQPMWVDFHHNPHVLIAGATGSGKSTLLHAIMANAIRMPNLKINLIDTKQIEFSPYDGLHNHVTVDFSYAEALERLTRLYFEMNETYDEMRKNKLPANYFSTHACLDQYTLVMIDEFADLILQDEDNQLYDIICKLAQKGRAAGIHLTIATQRPSVDIFRGAMKANFPARIACRVSSRIDSQVILDAPGAHCLLGRGDALIKTNQLDLQRFQVAYSTVDDNNLNSCFGDIE